MPADAENKQADLSAVARRALDELQNKIPAVVKTLAGGGGERGIRTPGPFGSTVFKTAALDRSAISPAQK